MFRSVCVALAVLVLVAVVPRGQACPRSCSCYQASEVHCTFRSLLTIPPGLPVHTRRINLGFNSIRRISDNSLAGLKRAELLMLHGNNIQQIGDGVFRDMKSLQILKLSYNKLRDISSPLTFSGLTSLLRLYLDHNLLQHIHPQALLQLPSLRLLRLQGNRLHQLHPHALCTLSLLNTYVFSTLRHLDLSNNSLASLPRETLITAPLLETLVLHTNPWSCDCRMSWFLTWSLNHPGLMKCSRDPQCPICDSPAALHGQSLLEQTELSCTAPIISSPGRDPPLGADLAEIQDAESFREPLGTASLGLSDQQENAVDLSCNVTHSTNSPDIDPPPDLSLSSSTPLPLALSLSLDCPVERESYEKLWRILAYYSETAVHLQREIMLSKAPALAYRYRQVAETGQHYHTGVKASVKATPHWLLQSAISIQLNRAESSRQRVNLKLSTRVATRPDPVSHTSASSPVSRPWVLISTTNTTTAVAAVKGSRVELPCPLLSSGNPSVQWILPDGSKLISPSASPDGKLHASASGLLLQEVKLSDAGMYYCVAQVGRDIDVLAVRLAVEESSVPPTGEQVGASVTGTEGEPVNLFCKTSGSPAPQISWVLPDRNILGQSLATSGGLTIQSNGSLLLPHPSLNDAGQYRCIAVNQYGTDSLSMQLILNPLFAPPLTTSFPRGPQSAAGRSTQIQAPLLHQTIEEEGSGHEQEEVVRSPIANRDHSRPTQPSINQRYPNGKPRRRGPMRGPPLRKGGRPLSTTEMRRNRFDNRHRVSTNKKRIDPQKWADLLAKIRQKTALSNNSQPVTAGEPTAEPMSKGEDRDTGRHAVGGDTQEEKGEAKNETESSKGGGVAEKERVEVETEGSSIDDASLQEEGLQPVYPETQIHRGTKTDTETQRGTERPAETQTDMENETETNAQAETGSDTETRTNPETKEDPVTSKPVSDTNEIVPGPVEGVGQGTSPNPPRTRLQTPRQGLFANLVPNSRPQRPWNSRRRIGQRRRIINRPRGRPLTPVRPLPDPTKLTPQTVTPDTATIETITLSLASTSISPATVVTAVDQIKTLNVDTTGVELDPLSHTVSPSIPLSYSLTPTVDSDESPSPPSSLSPSHPKTHKDTMTHSDYTPDGTPFTLFNTQTPAATHSNIAMARTQMPSMHIHKYGTQTHTQAHTPASHSSTTHSSSPSTVLATTAAITSTPPESTHSTITTSTTSKDTLPITSKATTITPTTTVMNPITSSTSTSITPTSSTTTTTTTSTSTTTETPFPTSTTPTTTSTTTISYTTPITSNTTTGTTVSVITILPSATPTTTSPPPKTASPIESTKTIVSVKAPSTTTPTATSATVLTSTSTRPSSRDRPTHGQVDPRGKPFAGIPNQRRPSTDWKNPGANSIPDSHSSRGRWTPSPSLPASPKVPALRSRPRIADPHIRTISYPAESTARLACEAQGEPKPSITWTKVSTGAVMSVHSRAQRFEVLPNGTLVIQNIQLQDRGTYICSAQSFLGRDRMLTTLEVWTRPPRMQQASYREVTTHQGGEVRLECRADGVPTPLLSWVLPDRSVLTSTDPSHGRITMHANGTLHISVTVPSDRGVYRCVASNSAGAASASVRVHVSSLPPVIHQPREERLVLTPGMPVYAHCSARGAPPPTLRWRIPDGTLVRPSQFLHGNLFVLPNGTLHIQRFGPKDAGSYECTASNAVGAEKRTVRVEVEGGRSEGVGEAEDGGTKTVITTTQPSPSSSLHKDKVVSLPIHPTNPLNSSRLSRPTPYDRSRTSQLTPSSSSPSRSSSYLHPPGSTHLLPKINKTVTITHLANFNQTKLFSPSPPSVAIKNNTKISPPVVNNTRVTPSSPSDRSRASSALYPSSPFSKARIVSTSPSITSVHYGGILLLHCTVTGNPSPNIIWRTPNRKLVDMHFSFDRRLKVHPNGTLSVQAVTEKDAGDYLCIARNKVADDYRLLRVSVATKPAKIEPKQPINQMVSLGGSLKVDCLASGLPDPAVSWSLPDGTMVNSVLQGEERGGRARRLTVFNNGTLLVPAVGMGEEGEYTCYAENQGGQDTMKVKVKVMMTSPTFTDDRSYHSIKVREGATAIIPCQATGDPAPTLTWLSPASRIIPRSLGSGYYSERVVVVANGTLEVRLAQKIDAGNYTCRASNSAGEKSRVVGLEVESPNRGAIGQVGGSGITAQENGKQWSSSRWPGFGQFSSNNGYSNGNGRTRNTATSSGINIPASNFNPTSKNDSRNGVNRPVSGVTTQLGSSVISVGVSGASNVVIKADNIGLNRNGPQITSRSNGVGHSHNTFGGDGVHRIPGTSHNEVTRGRTGNDANTGIINGGTSGTSRNNGVLSSSVSHNGAVTDILRVNGFSRSSSTGVTNDKDRDIAGASNTVKSVSNNTGGGAVTTVKQQVAKGQTVLLPCPSQGSPPPRLAWLLPGNGVLPAPYYGSRLTVHRNGSLELRGVRPSDAGTLVCVVRGERGETRIQVELVVSDVQEDAKAPYRGQSVERPSEKSPVLSVAPHSGASLDSARAFNSRPALPEMLHPRNPVTKKPPQRDPSSPAAPHPAASQPVVSTRTGSLVSIVTGETFRLPCSPSQGPGSTQGSLSWTLPSGKVLSRGETEDAGRYSVQPDGTLTVQQASVFDRGTYSCRSTSYDSSSVSLVTVPVIVIAYPPRITMGPSPVTYTRTGVAVELPCLTIATPRATITWETPDMLQLRVMGQARIYGNRYLSAQGSLVLQNPTSRDTGFYRCTAKNVIGADSKTTYLHVM